MDGFHMTIQLFVVFENFTTSIASKMFRNVDIIVLFTDMIQ